MITNNQQVVRAVKFLLGLRDPRAHQALLPYGMTPQVLEEGQQLLRNATLPRLDGSKANQTLLNNLDQFENHWFPIVKAVLSRRHPDIAEWLFNNLARTQGKNLVVSMDTFVQRLLQLEEGRSPFAERGKSVIELLSTRGFDTQVRTEATTLVRRIAEFENGPAQNVDTELGAQAIAELWGWYLEWSGIVRSVIKDRRVLRRLGFLQSRDPETGSEEAQAPQGGNSPVSPVSTNPAVVPNTSNPASVAPNQEVLSIAS